MGRLVKAIQRARPHEGQEDAAPVDGADLAQARGTSEGSVERFEPVETTGRALPKYETARPNTLDHDFEVWPLHEVDLDDMAD